MMDRMQQCRIPSRQGTLRLLRLFLFATPLLCFAVQAMAQQPLPNVLRSDAERQVLNRERVGLVTGLPGGAYARLGTEIAQLLDSSGPPPFRVVVQIGYGSVHNLDDLLNLQRVDFALLQSDVVEAYAASGQRDVYDELKRHMRIVATLHREEIHILARGSFRDLNSLAGKRVNIGALGSGTNLTARNLFARLNLGVSIDQTPTTQARAKLIDGSLDALVYVVGKGADFFSGIPFNDASRADLHFIPIPASLPNLDDYAPTQLLNADYPLLIEQGRPVETRAVTALLAVYAWKEGDPRYATAARFIDGLFGGAARLVQPNGGFSRDQWCQANLDGNIAGWQRFEAADRWLAAHRSVEPQLRKVAGSACPAAEAPTGCQDRFIEDMRKDGMVVSQPFSPRVQREFDLWRPGNHC
jgi:TRAP transporter TAXI family solute receptor